VAATANSANASANAGATTFVSTTGAITGADTGNYNALVVTALTEGDNVATITPAPLDIIADPQSKIFGASDPVLTFTVTGLVSNPLPGVTDTEATVLSGALTRVPGETALGGPYAITQGSLLANGNYLLDFTPGSLVIIGAPMVPVISIGVTNSEYYYRPGNFWHISLNPNRADPGFDVMRGTDYASSFAVPEGEAQLSGFIDRLEAMPPPAAGPSTAREGEAQFGDFIDRFNRRRNGCDSVFRGGYCETWSFPQQLDKVDQK